MSQQPAKEPIKNLRDAYRMPGFSVRAGIESYEMEGYGVAVLTLDRRSKKVCAVDAARGVIVSTIPAGNGYVILDARIGKCTSIFPCVGSNARGAA